MPMPPMPPELEERWWKATPAKAALEIDSSVRSRHLLQNRLGEDSDRWVIAVALMAADFPGSMAELADSAEEAARSGQCPPPPEWMAIDRAVDHMLYFAPEPAVDRIVLWMGPKGRRLLAEETTYCSEEARALIRHGDLAIRRELAKDRVRWDQGGPYPPAPDAWIIAAQLELDDPETNLWLLRDDRLTPRQQFEVLTGHPFGKGRTEPVPRLPETLALAERMAEIVDPRELARRFDASDPEHIMLALRATTKEGAALLDPYQQLVSGLLLARAGRTDLLTEALVTAPLGPDVRQWYTLGMTGQESPEETLERAVALTQRVDGFFDVARRSLGFRHIYGGTAGIECPSRLLAHSRALAEDPWYPLDWDVARSKAADPANWNPRGLPDWVLRALVRSADCPRDLVRQLAHEETADEYTFLHLFRNRAEGLDLLRSMRLTKDTGPIALWAATPDGEDWRPEITITDVLRLGRPARTLVNWQTRSFMPPFPPYVKEAVKAALDGLLSNLTPEQQTVLTEQLPTFEGTLLELLETLRTEAAAAGPSTEVEVIQAVVLARGTRGRAAAEEPTGDGQKENK
ncbi:hypothetical protein ACFZA1_41665 [Streptomyces filipinensis]|uniref:hypothetical protein n=1 Tax=Streptomyces filipinensis TaxID=66887 RepID=UPI0036E02202